jgi:hypothetical protein
MSPLSIFTLFNAQTLDYLFDSQAFVGFVPSVFLNSNPQFPQSLVGYNA